MSHAVEALTLGRTATRLQDVVSKDKKLTRAFSGFGPQKWKALGDGLKSQKVTRSVFTRNAIHFFLRFLLVETDVLGSPENTVMTSQGIDSGELGALIADNLLAAAHPKLSEAKRLGIMPEPKGTSNKTPTSTTRVTLVVLGDEGLKLARVLKRLGVDVPSFKSYQKMSHWGE